MGSIHTRLRVVNNTTTDIISTHVYSVESYDWDGHARPDNNFNGVFIRAKSSLEHREEINKNASHCPFNMTLKFRNGLEDTFRIHQRHAIGCCAGFEHIKRSHNIYYQKAEDNLLKITIENTAAQLQNELSERLNKEGEAAMNQKQYNEAIRKFDDALRSANQNSTINLIKNNKAAAYNEQGKLLFNQVWDIENDISKDRSQEATNKLQEAKSMIEEAEKLTHTSEQQANLKMINIKIEGNQLYNEANQLEEEAFVLFEKIKAASDAGDYIQVQSKYNEALKRYQTAKSKFEEGVKLNSKKFQNSYHCTIQQVNEISKVLDELQKIELSHNVKHLTVEEKNKKEVEDKKDTDERFEEKLDVA